MFPPIYTTLQASPEVRALLGARPRFWQFGEAPAIDPQSRATQTPYATWLLVAGAPFNTLSEAPDRDRQTVQIDVWGNTEAEVRDAARAVRAQLETVTHCLGFRTLPRDADTRLFRVSLDFDWLFGRDE